MNVSSLGRNVRSEYRRPIYSTTRNMLVDLIYSTQVVIVKTIEWLRDPLRADSFKKVIF